MIVTLEEDGSKNDNLQASLKNDIFPHVGSDEVLESGVRGSLEEIITWGFSGEGEGGEGVHDEVDPEHLNGAKGGFPKDSST